MVKSINEFQGQRKSGSRLDRSLLIASIFCLGGTMLCGGCATGLHVTIRVPKPKTEVIQSVKQLLEENKFTVSGKDRQSSDGAVTSYYHKEVSKKFIHLGQVVHVHHLILISCTSQEDELEVEVYHMHSCSESMRNDIDLISLEIYRHLIEMLGKEHVEMKRIKTRGLGI